MLSSKNQSEYNRKQNAVQTFSLKKLSIGLVSLAVGSFVFLGNGETVSAEEVVDEPVVELVTDESDTEFEVLEFTEEVTPPVEEVAPEVVEPLAETPAPEVVDEDTDEEEAVPEALDELDSTADRDANTVANATEQVSPTQAVESEAIEVDDDTLYITEEKRIEFRTTFSDDVSEEDLNVTLGGRPLSEWQSFNFRTNEFDGDPWIRIEEITINGREVFGVIVNDYPYGINATDRRPFPRWNFEELMGVYELAIVNSNTDERRTVNLTIGNYEGFHTYDELKPAIDDILDLAAEKDDRFFFYESLGKSYEGRDLHFVTITKDGNTLDRYLNETLKMAHENPEVLMLAIENGEFDNYQLPIFINNIHPDESPGVDAQLELLNRLATQDEIVFTTRGVEKSINISDLLDNFILMFSITMNPDGKYHNSRENSNKLDINRDNAFQTQIETQIMAEIVAKYNPLAFLDLHGFVNPLLIEPTTPPHEPNFEYDLLMGGIRNPDGELQLFNPNAPGAINHAIAMGEAAIGNTSLTDYTIPLLDWEDGWDDAGLGYTAVFTLLSGSLGHTIEIPQQNRESLLAAMYTIIGSFDYLSEFKSELYLNQLEVFRRSLRNIDSRDVDSWLVNSDLDVVGRNRGEHENFFPDYYFIPLDRLNQDNRLEAYNMVDYFLRNGVNVYTTNEAITYNGVTYAAGTVVLPLTQVKRGLVNAALSVGNDESNWGAMYAELVLNFPALRGFDSIAVRDIEINESSLTQVTESLERIQDDVAIETTKAVLRSSNNDALRLVNELLANGITVSLVQERAGNVNPGDYVVDTNDLTDNLLGYFVEYEGLESDLVVSPIVRPAVYVAPPENNYANLTTATLFVLRQLGFTIVDNVEDANVIVDASGMMTPDEIGDLPYIALGSSALRRVASSGLYDLEVIMNRGTHEGLLHAIYNQDSVISGIYDEESISYIASGSVLGNPREEAEVFARVADRDDFFIEGWWPNNDIARGGVLGFTDEVDGQLFTFISADVTNKAHTEYLYRILANSIYNSLTSDTEIVERVVVEDPAEETHRIVFIDTEGTFTQHVVDVVDGELVTPPTLEREGYELVGWRVAGEDDLFDFDTPITEALTLVAVWQEVETPGIGDDDTGGEETPTDPVTTPDEDTDDARPTAPIVDEDMTTVLLKSDAADEDVDEEAGEALPATATSTWVLGLLGTTSLLTGLGIKRKED